MKKENSNGSTVVIQLPKAKRNLVMVGCICLMLSIACFGLSLAVIQGPILEEMDAMSYFSTLTIFASLGLAILTPIGGKLGDLFGRRNIVIIAGSVASIAGIGMGIVKTVVPFMVLRFILGAAQGAFTAAPYILIGEIFEQKDVPKRLGLLSSSIAIGGFAGSIIAGILADAGLLKLGIIFPVFPLLAGILLIGFNLPNKKRETKAVIDYKGVVLLALFLSALLLSLNYGPKIGWGNIKIIVGFIAAIILGFILVKVERSAQEPIIPTNLFTNKRYRTLIIVGIIAYFYQEAMNMYAPLSVQKVLGQSKTISGALQFPRTILIMILPIFTGLWVTKKAANSKKAMMMATGLVAIAFIVMGFTTSKTPVIIYFVALALTGIAESFRAVSITPAAQASLDPSELGIGTSLLTFMNSLSPLFAAAICGIVFDVNKDNIQTGINGVFFLTALVAIIGFLIVLFGIKKDSSKEK
ncbi:MFS transporter [uncultured Clostridium sp.]|uniref:MFS transporter n=1 Tax=uncultured Clostridium sp. TaxID=59620 RepID=UPI0025CD84E9|nr:MFS transporter [uncultured Clostridium sp.]